MSVPRTRWQHPPLRLIIGEHSKRPASRARRHGPAADDRATNRSATRDGTQPVLTRRECAAAAPVAVPRHAAGGVWRDAHAVDLCAGGGLVARHRHEQRAAVLRGASGEQRGGWGCASRCTRTGRMWICRNLRQDQVPPFHVTALCLAGCICASMCKWAGHMYVCACTWCR